jgi:hypothetical protein
MMALRQVRPWRDPTWFDIDRTLAHDPALPTIRADLDDPRELSPLLRRKAKLESRRPTVETLQTGWVEAMGPSH